MKLVIHVKPGSSQSKIVENPDDGSLTVYLHAKPHGGEANAALMETLSKYLKLPKTGIKIAAGAKSRTKIIEF